MQTTTEFTWMLITFAALMAVLGTGGLGGVSLVWGAGMLLQIPYTLTTTLAKSFPLLAPMFILAFFYYFASIKSAVGEGFQMFILAAFIILILGV